MMYNIIVVVYCLENGILMAVSLMRFVVWRVRFVCKQTCTRSINDRKWPLQRWSLLTRNTFMRLFFFFEKHFWIKTKLDGALNVLCLCQYDWACKIDYLFGTFSFLFCHKSFELPIKWGKRILLQERRIEKRTQDM